MFKPFHQLRLLLQRLRNFPFQIWFLAALKNLNYRELIPAALLALIFVGFLAENSWAVEGTGVERYASLGGVFVLFSTVIVIVVVFLSLLVALGAGMLMDSVFVFQTGMGDTLHLIWVVVRNFVNTGFIILLLVLAVMVIFGIGQEGGTGLLKKVLPKFILALVVVNLTFFGARFILSVNDVFATAIFTLPKTIIGEVKIKTPCVETTKTGSTKSLPPDECVDHLVERLGEKKALTSPDKMQNVLSDVFGEDSWVDTSVKSIVTAKTMPFVLMTSMLDIKNITSAKTNFEDDFDAIISSLGSLLIAAAVGFVFLMLFLAFLIRLVVLWVMIAFSPVIALGLVFKEMFNFDLKGGGDFDILDIFIKHAFMPTLVAIPLSVGMIMLAANNAIIYDVNLTEDFMSLSSGNISGNLHALMWWIAALIVIWFGTNQIIQSLSPKFAHAVTSKIHEGVNTFAGGAAKTLQYAPIMPAWTGGGSFHGLFGRPMAAMDRVIQAGRERERQGGTRQSELFFPGHWTGTQMTKETMRDSLEEYVINRPKNDKQLGKGTLAFAKDILDKRSGPQAKEFKVTQEIAMQLNNKFNPSSEKQIQEGETYYEALRKIAESNTNANMNAHEMRELKEKLELMDSAKSEDGKTATANKTFATKDAKNLGKVGEHNLLIEVTAKGPDQGQKYLVTKDGDKYEAVVNVSQKDAQEGYEAALYSFNQDTQDEEKQKKLLETIRTKLQFVEDKGDAWAQEYKDIQSKLKNRDAFEHYIKSNIAANDLQKKFGL